MPGNNTKKQPSDRRDSLKQQGQSSQQQQQQQTNSKKNAQGRQKDIHFNNIKRQTHTGLNGFNGSEVTAFLNQRYSDTLTAFHNSNLDASVRPVKYESQEKAWGNKGLGSSSSWGQKGGTMANGQDFLLELVNRSK
ncbi:uncharacterized protein BX664DRAFT_335759 [Halteromyces radiatus]|uniref:uncharacterized protein n=1 Tax=Halteromyces radiatus TaxID=101107 RepID=UPI00221ED6A2|nr:uncharacterized protein BX664DRAFT_335759 [Halteromyces radiatus]KAI8086426.1 hypothetical protein BX664DRAFT_335759 [Halteromyces radiatus]